MICSLAGEELKRNIRHETEMVRGVRQGGKSRLSNVLFAWDVKGAESPEVGTVEDVVQHLLLLSSVSDLPAGVVQAGVVVGGVQLDLLVLGLPIQGGVADLLVLAGALQAGGLQR